MEIIISLYKNNVQESIVRLIVLTQLENHWTAKISDKMNWITGGMCFLFWNKTAYSQSNAGGGCYMLAVFAP